MDLGTDHCLLLELMLKVYQCIDISLTIGPEVEEKETLCCEDLDAVVVEVRDDNISMRVDSHIVRARQLGGRAAPASKLPLCFPLRTEDKDRAALSS